jgi:hypothetical protein
MSLHRPPSPGQLLKLLGKLLDVMLPHIDLMDLQVPINYRGPRDNLARFMRAGCADYTAAYRDLGRNFISPLELPWEETKDYDRNLWVELGETQPSEEVRQWLSTNGWVLLPGPSQRCTVQSLAHVYKVSLPREKLRRHLRDAHLLVSAVKPGWVVLPAPGASWDKSEVPTKAGLRLIPTAAEAIWGLVMYYRVRGVRLHPTSIISTSTKLETGQTVAVGNIGDGPELVIQPR